MKELQEQPKSESAGAPPFRIDAKLHQILYTKPASRTTLEPERELQTLPEPVFPQKTDEKEMTQSEYQKHNALRTWRSWGAPYFKSRWHRNELRPIIPYLFTEWKCNLDCHYCWSYNNRVKGMTEDTARRSIDWLAGTPRPGLAPTRWR